MGNFGTIQESTAVLCNVAHYPHNYDAAPNIAHSSCSCQIYGKVRSFSFSFQISESNNTLQWAGAIRLQVMHDINTALALDDILTEILLFGNIPSAIGNSVSVVYVLFI